MYWNETIDFVYGGTQFRSLSSARKYNVASKFGESEAAMEQRCSQALVHHHNRHGWSGQMLNTLWSCIVEKKWIY